MNGLFGPVTNNQNGTIKDIKSLPHTQYRTPTFLTHTGQTATVRLKSNSALPMGVPRTYTWTLTGFDHDDGGGTTTLGYWPTRQRIEGDGDVFIDPSNGGAGVVPSANPAGLIAATTDSVTGSYIDITLFSGNLRLGVMLTVSNNAGQSSTIHFPVCLRTLWIASSS